MAASGKDQFMSSVLGSSFIDLEAVISCLVLACGKKGLRREKFSYTQCFSGSRQYIICLVRPGQSSSLVKVWMGPLASYAPVLKTVL